jgi:hypothetical protein
MKRWHLCREKTLELISCAGCYRDAIVMRFVFDDRC